MIATSAFLTRWRAPSAAGETGNPDTACGPSRFARIGSLCYGAFLAWVLARHFFLLPPDTFFDNHDQDTYLFRVIEFRDCLAHGYWSPQWCTHFRAGLGGPYFSYYQPAFFYSAMLVPSVLNPVWQVGMVIWVFAGLGFAAMYLLVTRRFGSLAGLLAGTILLTSNYTVTDLYIRGDFSEFCAGMIVPWLLLLVDRLIDQPRRWTVVALASCSGLLVAMHPCIALPTYGALTAALIVYALIARRFRGPAVALLGLVGGSGLAAFYWLPVFWEWDYVSPGQAFSGFSHFSNHFIRLTDMVLMHTTKTVIPVKLGWLVMAVVVCAAVAMMLRWRSLPHAGRRLLVFAAVLAIVCLFLMNSRSQWLWEHLPLLSRLQFPWRLFTLLTIALACLSSAVFLFERAATRRLLAGVFIPLLFLQMLFNSQITAQPVNLPTTAAEIANVYVAPDIQNEWLPRGAVDFGPGQWQPQASEGVEVRAFQRRQGQLLCDFAARRAGRLILPHYYFPTGWHATLDGQPISLQRTTQGLMAFAVPPTEQGRLEVRFTSTPARRAGLWISLLTVVASVGLACSSRFCRYPRSEHSA